MTDEAVALLHECLNRLREENTAWGQHMNRFHAPRKGGQLSEAWWDCAPRSALYGDELIERLEEALGSTVKDSIND